MNKDTQFQVISQIEVLLNGLKRDELLQINKMIIQKVRIIDGLNTLANNAQFMPGDRVEWSDNYGSTYQGFVANDNIVIVIKINNFIRDPFR